ncbi:hypothetical protein SCOR_32740 [Sulfidibacter corallicola]|uniref:Uncharacterized protein n=1 Tax=Sulfidibacter corallicola TaxID=2818388 RepID=A0A8A4TKN1_SULCO|nr:hypothetical protein [Sulfidibacter corallicola]QTD49692.1 hypothetical protein J3U87_29260 [Sulfidibacter corallicola]
MSIPIQRFQQFAANRQRGVAQIDKNTQQLSVIRGTFRGREVQSLSNFNGPKLTKEQVANNQELKKMFAETLAKNYDGLFVMRQMEALDISGDRLLTSEDIARVQNEGEEHRLLSHLEVNEFFQSRDFTGTVKHVLNMAQRDRDYALTRPQLMDPVPDPLTTDPQEISRDVMMVMIVNKIPMTAANLARITREVTSDLAVGTVPDGLTRYLGLNQNFEAQGLARATEPLPHLVNTANLKGLRARLDGGGISKMESVTSMFSRSSLLSKPQVSPARFFGGVSMDSGSGGLFPRGTGREWMINFTVLNDMLNTQNLDPDTRKAVIQRALAYLYKFASVENPTLMGWQGNILSQGDGTYFRSGDQKIYKAFAHELESSLGLPKGTVWPVFDGRAMDHVKRQYEFADVNHKVMEITDFSSPAVFQRIAEAATEDNARFFLDISHLVANIPPPNPGSGSEGAVANGKAYREILDQVFDKLRLQVEINVRQNSPMEATEREIDVQVREIMRRVVDNTVLGGSIKVGDQDALYLSGFNGRSAGLHGSRVREMVYHGGHAAGPTQVLENWAALAPNLDSMLTRLQNESTELQLPQNVAFPKSSPDIANYPTLDAFTSHPAVRDLYMQATRFGLPEYADVLIKMTVQQINSLDHSVGGMLTDPDAGPVMQFALNRMIGHIENALAKIADMPAFLNHIHLIQEEISTLLAVARPYDYNDFGRDFHQVTDIRPDGVQVEPQYGFKNGGMHAFTSVLSGVEAMTGRRDLNVCTVKGTYYEESDHVVPEAAHYKKSVMDGGDVATSLNRIEQELDGKKLDVYVGEFHHNISASLTGRYKAENLIEQVRGLFARGLVSDHFTVAIDATIAKTDAPEIKQFLEAFKDEINDGRLNVVMFRSGQKFDMGGQDNLNAGFTVTYNNDTHFGAYNQGASNIGQPSIGNTQGMMHLELHCQRELNGYREAIMGAHRALLDPHSELALPKHIRDPDPITGNESLTVAPTDDLGNTVFLDIRSPFINRFADAHDDTAYTFFMNRAEGLAKNAGLTFGTRPSFGFAHSNTASIAGRNFRVTLGAITPKEIVGWREVFTTMRAVGDVAVLATNDPERFKNVITSAPSELFEAYRDMAREGRMIDFTGNGHDLTLEPKIKGKFSESEINTLAELWNRAGVPEAAETLYVAAVDKGPVQSRGMTETALSFARNDQLHRAVRPLVFAGNDDDTTAANAVQALALRARNRTALSEAEAQAVAKLREIAVKSPAEAVALNGALRQLANAQSNLKPEWARNLMRELVAEAPKLGNPGEARQTMSDAVRMMSEHKTYDRGMIQGANRYLVTSGGDNDGDRRLLNDLVVLIGERGGGSTQLKKLDQAWRWDLHPNLCKDNPRYNLAMQNQIAMTAAREGDAQAALAAADKIIRDPAIDLGNGGVRFQFTEAMSKVFESLMARGHAPTLTRFIDLVGGHVNHLVHNRTDPATIAQTRAFIQANFGGDGNAARLGPLLGQLARSVDNHNIVETQRFATALVRDHFGHFSANGAHMEPLLDTILDQAQALGNFEAFLGAQETATRLTISRPPLQGAQQKLSAMMRTAMDNLSMRPSSFERFVNKSSGNAFPNPVAQVLGEMAKTAASLGDERLAATLVQEMLNREARPDLAEMTDTLRSIYQAAEEALGMGSQLAQATSRDAVRIMLGRIMVANGDQAVSVAQLEEALLEVKTFAAERDPALLAADSRQWVQAFVRLADRAAQTRTDRNLVSVLLRTMTPFIDKTSASFLEEAQKGILTNLEQFDPVHANIVAKQIHQLLETHGQRNPSPANFT